MERDDDYSSFVADMWAANGIPLNDIVVERGYSASDRHLGKLVSLVVGMQGRLYVNFLEDGTRKTYRPEMHRWWRDGLPIHLSAFDGVRLGANPEDVLQLEYPARTVEEAISPSFNRFACTEATYAIDYEHPEFGFGWHVVSKVLRQGDKITARSHFRFGSRETFLHSGMQEVRSLPDLSIVELSKFSAKAQRPK